MKKKNKSMPAESEKKKKVIARSRGSTAHV